MRQPELGKKIIELRKAKGLTQEELVEKCNLNVRTLQRIESGEVTPRSYTIKIIFNTLDYSFDNASEMAQSKLSKTGVTLIQGLRQLYENLTDLINLKTNTMKKISILSLLLLLFSCLAFNLKVHSQPSILNPLIGKWKLVAMTKPMFKIDDSPRMLIKLDNSTTRVLEFKSDLSFQTLTIQNDLYNGGMYTMLNSTSFITTHFELNGQLASVANLYKFKIQSDTLHFTGFYLERAPQVGGNYYEKKLVDEWWVKLKN